MIQYLLLTLATLLLAVDFSFNKIYQKTKGTSPASGFGFNALLGLFTAIIFFWINGFKADFSVFSFLMAMAVNILVITYNIIGFRLLKSGTMAIYTMFLMSGGMILPYVFGLVFLGESFSALRMAGLVLILLGVIFSNTGGGKINTKQLIMCIAVFVLNGFVSITSKLHQTQTTFRTVKTEDFVLIGGLFKFVFAGIMYLIYKNKDKQKTGDNNAFIPLVIIALSAVAGGVSYLLQLNGAMALPASVLYPFITGGGIVMSSLAGVIVFGDKLSKNVVVSIVLCFFGTVLFL